MTAVLLSLVLIAQQPPAPAAKRTVEFTGTVLMNGFYNSARTNNSDDYEDGSHERRQNFVVARWRGTRGNHLDKNGGARQPSSEHVSAGLLRSAPEPREQQNQKDDRGDQRKGSGRERRVAERGTCKQKPDRGENNWPVQRARPSEGRPRRPDSRARCLAA